eukprot:3835609-Amphidinium_carterae.1
MALVTQRQETKAVLLNVKPLLAAATEQEQAVWQRDSQSQAHAGVPHNPNCPCRLAHVFYYPWYGNPRSDEGYVHWNHEVLPPSWSRSRSEPQRHSPEAVDIGALFWPALGAYSSRNTTVVAQHMQSLQRACVG